MSNNNTSLSEKRMEIYRKYGLKPTIVVKTGAMVIFPRKHIIEGGNDNEKDSKQSSISFSN